MATRLSSVSSLTALTSAGPISNGGVRPPAVPLVTCDPYFCIWSAADELASAPTTHWTGKPHRLTSLVRIDGKTFRVMGAAPEAIPPLEQVGVTVFPTRTLYEFKGGGVHVQLLFITPMLPDDLDVLARPVTYVKWTVRSEDGRAHRVAVYFDAAAELAVNLPEQRVLTSRHAAGPLTVLRVGSEDQPVLQTRGDDHRIDWGHLYLAAATSSVTGCIGPSDSVRSAFTTGAPLATDEPGGASPAGVASVLAFAFDLGTVTPRPVSTQLTLAYDDEYSIKYFRRNLRPYWRRNGASADDLLLLAHHQYDDLVRRCEVFDAELMADLRALGGESYAQMGALSWRQALAAQKLCADDNGQPLMFSKENFSNGCIATVDVLYPAAPQMLVFAPSLLKASLIPLLDYASSALWSFDSAPHDLGQYPHAVGQIYGGETTSPMPVEESGNMLIMLGALAKTEGNADFAGKSWDTLTTWKNYLLLHGLDPENQLCTDDFAGHIARNANLSIKAIMGIACYGLLAGMLGKTPEAAEATATAREYARRWIALAGDVDGGKHYKLVFGEAGRGTWSQKYNLVWDTLLELNIFPPEVARSEVAYYKTKLTPYGLPLDSRKSYTKLDWEYWTATLAEDNADFRGISEACARWASETVSRVPLTDWYETDTGKQCGFQARSVVGGVFIGLMKDRTVWKKYAGRDTLGPDNWAELPLTNRPSRELLGAVGSAPGQWS